MDVVGLGSDILNYPLKMTELGKPELNIQFPIIKLQQG
jgi:hypothetical protein